MSAFDKNAKIWMNGQLIPWSEANIHIASHVIHYGSSVFEGLRAYENSRGTAIFRLEAHTQWPQTPFQHWQNPEHIT